MRKLLRKLRLVNIDVYVYTMSDHMVFYAPDFKYVIQKEKLKNKIRFYIRDCDILVHESYLYSKVFLLRSLGKKGYVIGDCKTNINYRGQSIYPYVINQIAKEVLNTYKEEVFVVVNKDNLNSIKGIEKAGFSKYASIYANRWLWFYTKRQVSLYK